MAEKSLLSHEESIRLIKLAQAGDAQAQETLVLRNTALVKSIVKKFLNRGVEFDDLMQIGSLGLIKAIKGYDISFNVRFSTYAVPMIAGEIKRFLRDDGIIKVSRSLREKSFEIFGVKEQLKVELKREPTIEELAKEYEGRAVVAKVNTDNNGELAQSYGIQGIPSMLFFKGGKVADRVTGAVPKSVLVGKLDALLK